MTTLLLASASPARLATLRAAGLDPLVAVSEVDEPALLKAAEDEARHTGHAAPSAQDQVELLAQAKARDVVARTSHASHASQARQVDVVLGCDSMLELSTEAGTEIVGKPADAADARARWRRMRGHSGVLHTGHWLIRPADGQETGGTSSTIVHFADVSDAEIDAYVATGEPLKVAGAFTIDGLGGPFIAGIEGDHHGVVGVSLPLLRRLLGKAGVAIPDLWRPST